MTNFINNIIIGHALGDALGAPVEFVKDVKTKYTGDFSVPPTYRSRWQGTKTAAHGQWTDDTEMALCLWNSVLNNNYKFNRDDVIISYMKWANSKPFGMGSNTRNLFHGIKTLRGYKNRIQKLDAENAQSNGCLMRAWPLAFCDCDSADDTSITNPNDVCISAVRIYVSILKQLTKKEAIEINLPEDIPEVVKAAVDDGLNANVRDITENKGWVVHALYCAILATHKFESYLDGIDSIILMGGDTDTNAAIAGVILALRFPTFTEDERTKKLIQQMLECDTTAGGSPRPDCYHPKSYVL